MQALLLVWSFWCALIPQERVGFQVTAPGSLSWQVNSHSPDSGTDVHPAPETSTGTAAASPVAKLQNSPLPCSKFQSQMSLKFLPRVLPRSQVIRAQAQSKKELLDVCFGSRHTRCNQGAPFPVSAS